MKKQEVIDVLKTLGLTKVSIAPGTYFSKQVGSKWLGVDVYDNYAVIKKPIKKRVETIGELTSAIKAMEGLM